MHPQEKGSRRGTTNAYNINGLVDREMVVAAEERSYERCALETATAKTGARAPQVKNRQSGDACSRRAPLRHEVNRR
jgi:hypothetical protein